LLWLDVPDVKAIHRAQIDEHGGLPGIRDEGALDATLARPKQILHYQPEASLCQLAASLGYGFAKNPVFNDGNKRIAFMAMFVFLGANDLRLHVDETDAVAIMIRLAAGDLEEVELTAWLEANCYEWEE